MASQRRYIIALIVALFLLPTANAQSLEDAATDDFYLHTLRKGQQPQPLRPIRESDVMWQHLVWRTIDFREKFNQFFFFPRERQGIKGRKNFAYTIWDAAVAGEIPIYEDDELLIPMDNAEFVYRFTRADTITLEVEDDNGEMEYISVPRKNEFESEQVNQIRFKEVWYIDKQVSRQESRIIALAMAKDHFKEMDGDVDYIGTFEIFWIPMQSIAVRRLLAQNEAYFEDNIAHLPSWEAIFISHTYNSFITREDNRYNRKISDYLTGTDALLEAERIEDYLLEISEDMWEY